jgi:hypothetical protein
MIIVNYKGKVFSLKDLSPSELAELMKEKDFLDLLGVEE